VLYARPLAKALRIINKRKCYEKIFLLALCISVSACLDREEPITKTGLTRGQAMELAVKNVKGEASDEDLKEHGLSVGKPISGEAAKEMLLQELDALE